MSGRLYFVTCKPQRCLQGSGQFEKWLGLRSGSVSGDVVHGSITCWERISPQLPHLSAAERKQSHVSNMGEHTLQTTKMEARMDQVKGLFRVPV